MGRTELSQKTECSINLSILLAWKKVTKHLGGRRVPDADLIGVSGVIFHHGLDRILVNHQAPIAIEDKNELRICIIQDDFLL